MAWRGFLTESQAYWGYPRHRWLFWCGVPRAALRFYGFCLYDWMRQQRKAVRLWWRQRHG